MKQNLQTNYIQIEENVNLIFACDKTERKINLEQCAFDAEMALLRHLQTAFNLIERSTKC